MAVEWVEIYTDLDKKILQRRDELRGSGANGFYGDGNNHPVAQQAFWESNRFSNCCGSDPTDEQNNRNAPKNVVVNNFYAEKGAKIIVKQKFK